jgi:hypothetical protein
MPPASLPASVVISPGVVVVPLPMGSSVKVTGFVNTSGWAQQIIVAPTGGPALTWTGNGTMDNRVVGQVTLAPAKTSDQQLKVQMQYNPGGGYQLSDVRIWVFNEPGLSGYVIGGQDGGGRPVGPAYWNTMVFVYWAVGY